MTTQLIKQRIHNYLEVADYKKVRAIYTMMENEIEKSVINETLKSQMDKRLENYKKNTSTSFNAKQSKKRIEKILKSSI